MADDAVPARLGHRFHRLWGGYVASNFADGVLLTALPLMALTLTRDPLLISGLTAMWYLPWLLFGLHAGALADRMDRTRLIVGANALRGALMLALLAVVAAGGLRIWVLYLAMFLLVACETVVDSAGRAIVPEYVAAPLLGRANSRLEGGRTVAEGFVAAPAASFGLAASPLLPLGLNTIAYVASAAVMPRGPGGGAGAPAERAARGPLLRDIKEGLAFIWGDPVQRGLCVTSFLVSIAGAMLNAVLVVFAVERVGVPHAWYGALVTALALGSVLGAVSSEAVTARTGRARALVSGYVVLGVSAAQMAVLPHPVTSVLGLFLTGIATMIVTINLMTITQAITPAGILGRAISVRRVVARGLGPLAAVGAGLLARVDLALPILAAGAIAVVVGIAFSGLFTRAARCAAAVP
ncbi:MFS transporter [Murinocardiopsis flavida]|uniref:MFS transporter n=1 Tax=Murinocardiopsis flavida TaxID=645275 RepID=A0A2P8DKM3_9ACTN|nr:MFS transporter [Murinocardiopsis flavida]PSK97775.1 MFS transporter [Murinocardiopsis flavida]